MVRIMFIGFVIGFFAGIFSTIILLVYLASRQNKQNKNQKLSKSPYSDINLMDTKMDTNYKNCG